MLDSLRLGNCLLHIILDTVSAERGVGWSLVGNDVLKAIHHFPTLMIVHTSDVDYIIKFGKS